jgi:hypothetical protein
MNTARAVTKLRQDELVRQRMADLGAKASAGQLSPEEEREYDALIEVSDVIATLQLKARQRHSSPDRVGGFDDKSQLVILIFQREGAPQY